VKIALHRSWMIATLVLAAIAAILACLVYLPKSRPDEKAVSAAQDQVYEAVVRDMLKPATGAATVTQLVFDDTVLTERWDEPDTESCKESARRHLGLEGNKPPPFNTLADKIYRAVTGGWYDGSPRADAIQDFLDKSCTAGPVSTTFHTDLPRDFIRVGSVGFGDLIVKNGPPTLQQIFPGASGIISFSRVGFDSSLHEALVSTSFICGGLCGTGWRYVLRKKAGSWKVVSKWIVWVS
jgi:hypothetical protein